MCVTYNLSALHIFHEKSFCLCDILQGNRLVKVLGLAKGPQMGQMLEAQVRWQLRQPTGTVAQCVEHLKQVLASLPVIEKENTDIGKACKKKS